jgi:hypothetical protein
VASGFFQREGSSYPWFWGGFANATLESMPKELREAYLAAAPHPENLQSFFDKCVQRMRTFEDTPRKRSAASLRQRSSWWATPT